MGRSNRRSQRSKNRTEHRQAGKHAGKAGALQPLSSTSAEWPVNDGQASTESVEVNDVGAGTVREDNTKRVWFRPFGCWWRRSTVAVGLVLALLLLLPRILGHPLILNGVIQLATADLPYQLQVGRAELQWLAPTRLRQLAINDAQGRPMAQVKQVQIDRSLWQLIRNRRQLGTIRVDAAEVWVDVRSQGTSWDELFAAKDNQQPTETVSSIQWDRMSLTDATVHLRTDSTSASGWTLAGISSELRPGVEFLEGSLRIESCFPVSSSTTSDDQSAVARRVSGKTNADRPPIASEGANALQVRFRLESEPNETPNGHAATDRQLSMTIQSEQFPIGPLRLLAHDSRNLPALAGSVSGNTTIDLLWGGTVSASLKRLKNFDATLQLNEVSVAPFGALREPCSLKTVTIEAAVKPNSQQRLAGKCHIRTELGKATVTAVVNPHRLLADRANGSELFQSFHTDGEINLARMAAALPATLRLHEGVAVDQGRLHWVVEKSDRDQHAPRWTGQLTASNLAGRHNHQRLELQQPVRISFDLQAPIGTQEDWHAEQLELSSTFLTIAGNGNREQGRLRWHANGQRLAQDLGQFFDMRSLVLRGQLEGELRWQTIGADWKIEGQARGQHLVVARPDRAGLREPEVDLQVEGMGRFQDQRLQTLNELRIQLRAGSDRLTVQLAQPLSQPSVRSNWPLRCQLEGDIKRWRDRTLVGDARKQSAVSGDLTATAVMNGSSAELTIHTLQATAHNVGLDVAGTTYREPTVQVHAEGTYDLARGVVQCPSVSLASTSVSIKARDLRWPVSGISKSPSRMRFRADLGRLSKRADFGNRGRMSGQMTGQLSLQPRGDGFGFALAADIDQFAWRPDSSSSQRRIERSRSGWHEPLLEVEARGRYSSEQADLLIEFSQLQGEAISLTASGSLDDLNGRLLANLKGQSQIDLAQLSQYADHIWGRGILLRGISQSPFSIQGPLRVNPKQLAATNTRAPGRSARTQREVTSPRSASRGRDSSGAPFVPESLRASWEIAWDGAQLYGLDAGPARVSLRLDRQQLEIASNNIPLSDGTLRWASEVSLKSPVVATLPAGRVADQINLTPEVCRQWLKYVAPLLADATAAEGRFSAKTSGARIPLASPHASRVGGALVIHAGRVGPGPATRELLQLAQQIHTLVDPRQVSGRWLLPDDPWVELPTQNVSFRIEDGRVVHRGLTMIIGNVRMQTQGWVGFDQQISLVAEIPIQAEWLDDNRWLANLKSQSIKVPIRGRIGRPRIDRRAFQNLARMAAQGAAEDMLRNQLQRELQRQLQDLFQ